MTSISDRVGQGILSPEELAETIGDFKAGSITCIKLKNFMTHAHAVIRPGPRLNLVCGANGTGKSTLLNAICLGLGGAPKVLGRQDDVREYIMHGQDVAEIQVTLAGSTEAEETTFLRVLDRNKGNSSRGASTYFINDEKATEKQVTAAVSGQYNIAIDNLCTFLPQDKVGSFSGFTDEERLVETEKTLTDNMQYYYMHQELIQAETEMANESNDVDLAKDNLKRLKHENEGFERAVQMQTDRCKALAHAALLDKKRVWLAFDTVREEALAVKAEKESVKEQLKAANASLQPLEQTWEKLASSKKQSDLQEKTLTDTIAKSLKELEKQKTKFETHDDGIEVLTTELLSLESKRHKLEQEHVEATDRLAKIVQLESQQPNMQQVDEEFKQASALYKESRRAWEKAKQEERQHRSRLKDMEENAKSLAHKLAKMNDEGARRREKIFSTDGKLAKIYHWIDQNRSKFRRPVHGPIVCEVTTKSQESAAFLEFHAPNKILKSFVVETKEDYDLLYRSIREELRLPINVIEVTGGKLLDRALKYSEQKMKILKEEHGVQGYLDDCYTASDAVRQALRDWASVQDVLVGGEGTQRSIDDKGLLAYLSEPDPTMGQQNLVGSSIFASQGHKSYRYTSVVSRYSRKLNSRVDDVKEPRMLAPGVNPQAKLQVEEKLAEAHQKLDELRPIAEDFGAKAQEYESQSQEHRTMAEASKQAKEHVLKFQTKLDRARRKVEDSQAALALDDTVEKKKLAQNLMSRISHSITAVENHAEQHEKMMEATIAAAGVKVNASHIVVAERQAKLALADGKQAFETLEKEGIRIHQQFARIKKKLTEIKKEADERAPLSDADGNPTELKEQLETIELVTLDEVEAAIEDAMQTANRIDDDPTAVQEYERRKQEIDEIEESLANLTNSKDVKLNQIETKRSGWESALEEHCAKINELFATYMSEMGCTGEVRLKKGDTEEHRGNFKDWGIEILVSFRENTKAQILSQHRHSGGERSVSTIMYLMALQDLMVAPFRCVDEINQGLDDRNERLVFKRIVANSTRKPEGGDRTNHSGQYWLITPKLLPNLTDMEEEAVTILFVLNGQHNFKSPMDWDVDRLVSLAETKRPIENEANDEEENTGNAAVEPRKSKKRRS